MKYIVLNLYLKQLVKRKSAFFTHLSKTSLYAISR